MPLIQKKASDLKTGDMVQIEGWSKPTSVTDTHIILHMGNNMDVVATPDQLFYVIENDASAQP